MKLVCKSGTCIWLIECDVQHCMQCSCSQLLSWEVSHIWCIVARGEIAFCEFAYAAVLLGCNIHVTAALVSDGTPKSQLVTYPDHSGCGCALAVRQPASHTLSHFVLACAQAVTAWKVWRIWSDVRIFGGQVNLDDSNVQKLVAGLGEQERVCSSVTVCCIWCIFCTRMKFIDSKSHRSCHLGHGKV